MPKCTVCPATVLQRFELAYTPHNLHFISEQISPVINILLYVWDIAEIVHIHNIAEK